MMFVKEHHDPRSCAVRTEINNIYSHIEKLWKEMKLLHISSRRNKEWRKERLSSKRPIHFSKYSQKIDSIGNEFLRALREDVTNCGSVTSINFLQLVSLTGLLPPEIAAWSSIAHENSGGYNLIRKLLPTRKIDFLQAQYYLWDAQSVLEYVFGSFVSLSFIENCLCEFLRDMQSKSGISQVKDVYFKTKYHLSCQSYFRMKHKSAFELSIEMMPGNSSNNFMKEINVPKDEIKRNSVQEVMCIRCSRKHGCTIKNHFFRFSDMNTFGLPTISAKWCIHDHILHHY